MNQLNLQKENFYAIYLTFVFLTIDLYFLVHAVISQFFSPIVEFVISIGTASKEVEAETHTLTAGTRLRTCSI